MNIINPAIKFLVTITLAVTFNSSIAEEDNNEMMATIEAGNKSFYRFCSICHAPNGEGNGMFSDHLVTNPPDLTRLSKNNNNNFPWIDLYKIINGNDINPEHGTPEMPIWGNQFDLNQWDHAESEFSDVIVRGRIFEILVYLQSIQK
ncbi:MAG: hypothetical protein R8G33_04000 [Gammaproteobacteria bacterium]|nr:hypothetical protein [Gammaproteobacteria bacterium]